MATFKYSKKIIGSCLIAILPLSAAFAQEEKAKTAQVIEQAPTTSAPKPAPKTLDPASLPVEAFARLPFVERPQLSPDGKKLAGLMGMKGRQHVVIMDLFNTAELPFVAELPDEVQAHYIQWVNDDNIVVSLQALQPLWGDSMYVSRLVGITHSAKKITKFLWDLQGQNASDILWIPDDGTSRILVAAQSSIYSGPDFWPKVYSIDVVTGNKKVVLSGYDGVMNWQADDRGNVRSGVRYATVISGKKSSLLYRSENSKSAFKTIDRANFEKEERLLSPFLFIAGTDNAFTVHEDEKGSEGIYEVDLNTLADVRNVYKAEPGVEIYGTLVSKDEKGVAQLIGVRTSSSKDSIHWIDPNLAELQNQFNKSVGTKRAQIISLSKDRKSMLVWIDRSDSPGSLYFYNTDYGVLQKIADNNSTIGARSLSPVRSIKYKARDGLEIEAILTVPKGLEEKNLPIIMMPHGGPWAQDSLNYDYWAQFIASRGYIVMQPNFRGSTGYGEAFTDKGKGQLGLAMQDDVTDGLRWAVEQGIADPKRACIVGASYGGYAAMWGIAKDPELYRCAISISGVSNLRKEVNDFRGLLFATSYRAQWEAMTPDFAAVSPVNAISRITKPLLLIHGKKDITVDHVQSSSMFNKMQSAGKDVQFVSLPDADHYFTRQADREVLLSSIETFLKANNPAEPVKK